MKIRLNISIPSRSQYTNVIVTKKAIVTLTLKKPLTVDTRLNRGSYEYPQSMF